jgi:hydroxyacylglutathione hydrolase
MIKIETFSLGPIQTNAYLLINQTTERAIVMDPGMNPAPLLKRIQSLHVEAILLTHAHFDHIAGVTEVRRAKACPVYVHPLEADWLTDAAKNGSARWSEVTAPITTEPAEYDLAHRQRLSLIGIELEVLHTPGHSPGSVSFLYQGQLFAGDVLFKLSVGRTDLPGGNARTLMQSIQDKVFTLPAETVVYPGHGPKTTVGYEKMHNPYV